METQGLDDWSSEKVQRGTETMLAVVAATDAVGIYKACKGLGTDEDALIDILCNRSKDQLKRINEQYKANYQVSLLELVQDECGGDLRTFLVSVLSDPTQNDAQWLFKAMDGIGTTEKILSEIIVNRTNDELARIKTAYEAKFDRPLIDAVNSETSGNYRDFLVACLQCKRSQECDSSAAKSQAGTLHDAVKPGSCCRPPSFDVTVFTSMLSTMSIDQARNRPCPCADICIPLCTVASMYTQH